MKKLYVLMLLLCISFGAFAKDTFYYSGDEKIKLQEIAGKEVVIFPAATTQIAKMAGFSGGREIKDDRLAISVVSESTASLKTIKHMSVPVRMEKCYRDSQGLELIPTGYINLKLKKSGDRDLLDRRAAEFGLEITEQNRYMPLWFELVINFENESSVIDIANRLFETGDFETCSPAFSFDGREISYDTYTSNQWGLYNAEYDGIDINIVPAWDYATGKGIPIAFIDGGVELTHTDLAKNAYLSIDCATGASPNIEYDGHGTMCAGITAAVRNNNFGIAGVAPDAKIMSARVDFSENANTQKQLADAINWSCNNGAYILSCSWGSSRCKLIEDAIDAAVTLGRNGKGCIFVCSAGNNGQADGSITYPGGYREEVLTISGVMKDGDRYIDSSYGDAVFVSAPGKDIYTTTKNNGIVSASGTSMACAFVSGVAALILERNPNLTANHVREILANSTNRIGPYSYSTQKEFGAWNKWYGYGMIDAYQAVMNTPRR